ncbi:nucleotidyltransferase family protein [Apilactobacillus micheneri]
MLNAVGIISEYNPFHNGHLYQIKKSQRTYPC